jgi:hypothetical protein
MLAEAPVAAALGGDCRDVGGGMTVVVRVTTVVVTSATPNDEADEEQARRGEASERWTRMAALRPSEVATSMSRVSGQSVKSDWKPSIHVSTSPARWSVSGASACDCRPAAL